MYVLAKRRPNVAVKLSLVTAWLSASGTAEGLAELALVIGRSGSPAHTDPSALRAHDRRTRAYRPFAGMGAGGGAAPAVDGHTELVERDRDLAGRPRSARPRDGLGRPLPYGASGVPRLPEGVVRAPEQTLDEAQRLLDSGRPFHAHEVFEDAWKAARGAAEAGLWKALAQLAVGCTHRARGNAVGAKRLLLRAAAGLTPYLSTAPHGLNLAQLIDWAEQPAGCSMPRLRNADPPGDRREPEDKPR